MEGKHASPKRPFLIVLKYSSWVKVGYLLCSCNAPLFSNMRSACWTWVSLLPRLNTRRTCVCERDSSGLHPAAPHCSRKCRLHLSTAAQHDRPENTLQAAEKVLPNRVHQTSTAQCFDKQWGRGWQRRALQFSRFIAGNLNDLVAFFVFLR